MSGDFTYEYFKIDSVEIAISNDFKGANPLFSNYPQAVVDSIKLPNFGGDLISMEVFHNINNSGAEAIYSYHSSQSPPSEYEGLPVAFRNLASDNKVIFIGFPLYYIFQSQAKDLITQALLNLGEVTSVGGDENAEGSIPDDYDLKQNYPNPFNPSTVIEFSLPNKAIVNLEVYNILGERIETLISEKIMEAGIHKVLFDASKLSSGVYIYKIKANQFVKSRKMILVK